MNRTNHGTSSWALWALCLGLAGCPENANPVADEGDGTVQPDDGTGDTGGDNTSDPADDGGGNEGEDETPDVGENDAGVGDDDGPDAGDDGDLPSGDDLAAECTNLSIPNMSPAAVDQLTEFRAQVKESRATFDALDNPHYRYSRSLVSFSGMSCDVTFEVKDGVVVAAEQTRVRIDPQTGQQIMETPQSASSAAEVQSKQWCFVPKVLGELYDQCLSETLCQNPDENRMWVTIAEDTGLLSNCTYWPEQCADDCLFGVSFKLELL